jgi:hypothetical protein
MRKMMYQLRTSSNPMVLRLVEGLVVILVAMAFIAFEVGVLLSL